MSEAIAHQIAQFVERTVGVRSHPRLMLTSVSPLFSSRLMDSMALVELLAFVEREFRVSINATAEELTALDTPARLAEVIERMRQEQGNR